MSEPWGRLLSGTAEGIRRAYDAWQAQPVDWDRTAEPGDPPDALQSTIARPVSVTGPGTFFGRAFRRLTFEPSDQPGWWFERADLPYALPISVSVRQVWTTQRNIVLLSGSPHNYMRMVEHIVMLRLGMALDNIVVKADSGDPPLFDRGSLDLVEALEGAGRVVLDQPVAYVTVREPVTVVGPHGSFLTLLPWQAGAPVLQIDCAIDFADAIGRQRIRFNLSRDVFRYGALARTNTTARMKWYCRTLGQLFADTRNLGYTDRNILIAGRRRYLNEPKLPHAGKSLEAVWHRAMLDLLAALALIDRGRFAGHAISYKAGHALDVQLVTLLYKHHLLKPVVPQGAVP